MISEASLIACGIDPLRARFFLPHLAPAMQRFGIFSQRQRAGFLAHAIHESTGFSQLHEGLNYRDPERIARIFRKAFDLDRDGAISTFEIEQAKVYVNAPERLANKAYANRYGNGSEVSGDGWRYRGRGLFQLTFKDNYAAAGKAIGVDYVADPEAVARPDGASLTAAEFWTRKGCNALMDGVGDDILQTTKVINPGLAGLEERRVLFERCLAQDLR